MTRKKSRSVRRLVLVLGDQLDSRSAAFDGFDRDRDVVWMAEVAEESTHVWTHKARIATFLAAMRHFRDDLQRRGIALDYRQLDDRGNKGSLSEELSAAVRRLGPESLVMVEPGEWRVRESLVQTAEDLGISLDIRPDRHFFCSHEEFAQHIRGRKQIRLEYFYREMRRKTGVLMDGDQPLGGKWNFDQDNRGTFSKAGPGQLSRPRRFRPDTTTREVLRLVERRFARHPGRLDHFDWPLTTRQAKSALKDFIEHRLPQFGQYQDAIWQGEPYLYHSRISAAMNLKLLDPRDVVREVEQSYHAGHAPLNAVEGFIRQILGCPITTLYWDFLMRHEKRLSGNNRMTMQLKNLGRKSRSERSEIRRQAGEFIEGCS